MTNGLEQFERHAPRQAALVQSQFGTGDDDRASGIINSLAEQVLPEATLLSPEQVGRAT